VHISKFDIQSLNVISGEDTIIYVRHPAYKAQRKTKHTKNHQRALKVCHKGKKSFEKDERRRQTTKATILSTTPHPHSPTTITKHPPAPPFSYLPLKENTPPQANYT